MEAKSDKRLRIAGWLLSFPILLTLTTGAARAERLYTRMDELSCGDARVQAFTTCTEDSHDIDTAVCTDQYFVFIDKRTNAAIKVDASGKPIVYREAAPGQIEIWYDALARDWACLESRTGPLVYLMYGMTWDQGEGDADWEELLDLKGKRLASARKIPINRWSGSIKAYERYEEKILGPFFKVWNSKDLPVHPAPLDAFDPIQIFKTDRTEKYWDMSPK